MDVGPYMASPLLEKLTQLIHQRNQLELLIDFYQRVGYRTVTGHGIPNIEGYL